MASVYKERSSRKGYWQKDDEIGRKVEGNEQTEKQEKEKSSKENECVAERREEGKKMAGENNTKWSAHLCSKRIFSGGSYLGVFVVPAIASDLLSQTKTSYSAFADFVEAKILPILLRDLLLSM